MSFAAWLKSFKLNSKSACRPSIAKRQRSKGIKLSVEVLEDRVTPSAIWFVNPAATGSGAGTNWGNAFTNLPTALSTATTSDQIWVAEGTYSAASGSFSLPANVAVYGGFNGTETALSQRNVVTNLTLLDGGNAHTVVFDNNSGDTSTVLDGFTVQNGQALDPSGSAFGGGMYDGAGSAPTVSNVIFTNNSAAFYGGGMYNAAGSTPTVTNVTFTNNGARSGGGMFNESSSPTVTNVTFSNNGAAFSGGGMFNDNGSSPIVTNATFSYNSTTYSLFGYAHGGGMANWNYSSPNLTNVTFSQNSSSTGEGGGIFSYNGCSPTLLNVTFSNNLAYYGGGGMSGFNGSPTLTNVMFIDNSADPAGGFAGGMGWAVGSPILTNVVFVGNSAFGGGAMSFRGSSPTVTNVTFTGNSATFGGGIYDDGGSSPTITNAILWNDAGGEIYNTDGTSNPVVTYSDVQGGYSGTGNINADPLFVNAAAGNVHLQASSPAVGAGTSVGAPSTDLDGNPRPAGGPIDMGAYQLAIFTPTVVATDASGPYTGNPFTATATVTGIGSDGTLASSTLDSATLSFSYYAGSSVTGSPIGGAPTNPGTYTVVAHYSSDKTRYTNADSSPVTFNITQATLPIFVTSDLMLANRGGDDHGEGDGGGDGARRSPPPLTGTVNGISFTGSTTFTTAQGDTLTVTLSSSVTATSPVGVYPIIATVTGAASAKYVQPTPGNLYVVTVGHDSGTGARNVSFWDNRGNAKLITATDLTTLDQLNLENNNGSAFDPTVASSLQTWLRSDADRIVKSLSIQLAVMDLNVLNGYVTTTSVVYAGNLLSFAGGPFSVTGLDGGGFISIGNLMTLANNALANYTPAGRDNDGIRLLSNYMDALEDALEAANNNASFVQQSVPSGS